MNRYLGTCSSDNGIRSMFALLCALTGMTEAFGETRINHLVPLADATIQEIRSSEGPEYIFRAILKSEAGKVDLFLEKFQKNKANEKPPVLVESWKLKDLRGGETVKTEKKWSISDLEHTFAGFKFKNTHVSGSIILDDLECEIRTVEKSPAVSCKEKKD